MSGSKQHILPRFLLQGFASRIRRKEYYCWIFRREAEPFETNIRNVLVCNKFYEDVRGVSADGVITALERRLAGCVDRLRQEKSSIRIAGLDIPELVVHLMVRTRFLRDMVFQLLWIGVESLLEQMRDPKVFSKVVLNSLRSDPKILEEFIGRYPLSQEQRLRLYRLAVQNLPQLAEEMEPQFQRGIDVLIDMLKEHLDKIKRDAHIKSLLKSVAPESRLSMLKGLNWFLVVSNDVPLILGDFGPLYEIEGKRRFMALPDKDDKIKAVYLPLSNKHLIVGSEDDVLTYIDFEQVNFRVSECSYECFVSSSKSSRKYSVLLGQNAYILPDSTACEIVFELLRESNLRG